MCRYVLDSIGNTCVHLRGKALFDGGGCGMRAHAAAMTGFGDNARTLTAAMTGLALNHLGDIIFLLFNAKIGRAHV